MKRFTVLPEDDDSRLDRVLERLLPDMGLRGRRRLCELGLASVNGRTAQPARKVRTGDVVEIRESSAPMDENSAGASSSKQAASGTPLFPDDLARVVAETPHLTALYKPAAMHTETLAGKPGTSLQSLLPELIGSEGARLLNRLDYPTSGITIAALDAPGEKQYRDAQECGLTTKRYLTLLEGTLEHDMLATQKLLLKNRSRVLVELTEHPDIRRHTAVHPLAVLDASALCRRLRLEEHGWTGKMPSRITLAGCTILKGARHQIRAHCSALGYPLLGDRRYGALLHPAESDTEAFFLHHARLILPSLDALVLPVWLPLLDKTIAERAVRWLKG